MASNTKKQNKRSNILVATEAALIAYVSYLTHFLMVQLGHASNVALESMAVNIGVTTIIILLCSLSVGLYEAKLRETFRGIIRRIFVSVGISFFAIEVILEVLFKSMRIEGYFLPASMAIIIVTLVVFRYFTNRLGLLA